MSCVRDKTSKLDELLDKCLSGENFTSSNVELLCDNEATEREIGPERVVVSEIVCCFYLSQTLCHVLLLRFRDGADLASR